MSANDTPRGAGAPMADPTVPVAPEVGRTAILVLGMHRSGTSALTRLISLLGADLPDNLMPPREGNNETGFWESQDVCRLNDAILARLESRWDDWRPVDCARLAGEGRAGFLEQARTLLQRDFAASSRFVLKDPRICRLLPFWVEALTDFGASVKCVLSIRNPLEVAASLERRDGFIPAKSCALWLRHVLEAERASRALPRIVLAYEDLLTDWRQQLRPMAQAFGLPFLDDAQNPAGEADAFLRSGLRHHAFDAGAIAQHPQLAGWIEQVYVGLNLLRADPASTEGAARLDRVSAELGHADRLLAPVWAAELASRRTLEARTSQQVHRIEELDARLREQGENLERLQGQAEGLRADRDRLSAELAEVKHALGPLQRERDELQFGQGRLRARGLALATERRDLAQALSRLRARRGWWRLSAGDPRWPVRFALPPWHGFGSALTLRQRVHLRACAVQLLGAGLFDARWYAEAYADVLVGGADPLWHWLLAGWREGRQPNAVFDPKWYLARNPDVAAAGVNPLLHYWLHGAAEGRDPGPLFQTTWYLAQNPDVATSGMNPLAHYLQHGATEGRAPNPLFEPRWYLDRNPDVAEAGWEPLQHYLLLGGAEGRDPGPAFRSARYLAANPDVAASGMNPLVHYLGHGVHEGRRGGPDNSAHPAAVDTSEPFAEETFKGQLETRPELPNVAVFAHVVAGHLFGGERSFIDVLEKLRHVPCNVHVVLPRRNDEYLREVLPLAVEVSCIPYWPWERGKAPQPASVAAIRAYLIRNRIDLVHVNTIVIREPLLAARRLGVPSAIHVRESVLADRWLSDKIGLPPDDIIRTVADSCDYVIANSPRSAEEFRKNDRTFVVPNSFDIERLDLENRLDPACIRIGLISSNIPKKGIEDFALLAAACAPLIPNLRFVLIGPRTPHIVELEERQRGGQLPATLEFVGYQETPAAAVGRVNIVANLSHFAESFGRTVAEALAARRPAIVYDLGATQDLVSHGQTGFVIPFGQWRDAVPHLQALCREPEKILEMGRAGRAFIEGRYARGHGAQALVEAYAQMLRRRERGDVVVPALKYGKSDRRADVPLRLAYFCWHFPVPSETFVLNELRLLVAQGVDVEVYCRQSPHADFRPDFDIRWQRVASVDELVEALRRSGRTHVHAHFTYPTVTDMVWPACEKAEVPFTFIAHAQDIFKFENDRRNRVGEIGQSALCRAVFVLGSFHRDYLIERGVPAHKLIINPNGIEPEQFAFTAPRPRPEATRRRVCAIHRFAEKKGLHDLVAAADLLRGEDIEFNLYGYGEEEPRLRALIEQHQLDNVRIMGPLKGWDAVAATMREHDLFACPSVRTASGDMDGIPTALIESMACGTPVITTDVASIPDLVQDGITGVVVRPGDPASLADGIRRFFAMDAEAVRSMAINARAAVERRHDVRRLAGVLKRVWCDAPVDLVIVSWNNLPELREVIARIFRFTRTPFHLTVCDNASAPEVVVYLNMLQETHDNVSVVYRAHNTFVGPGTNAAADQGCAKYLIYLCGKEGFVLAEGWETALIDYMDRHPRVGLGGTLCYSPSYLTGADYPKIPTFGKFRNPQYAAEHPQRIFSHVQGGLFVIRRSMYEQIGGFSDAVPHAHTDVEYSYYVESTGWLLGQVPEMLALYNKTAPNLWSRIDEHVRVLHPPRLRDLPLLDRIARRETRFCNVCGWEGEAFEAASDGSTCPKCRSLPVHRTLNRALAEGTLTYRQLPALWLDPHACLVPFWTKAFRGATAQMETWRPESIPSPLALIVALDVAHAGDALSTFLTRLHRLLQPDGQVILAFASGSAPAPDVLIGHVRARGFRLAGEVRHNSAVVSYAMKPIYVLQRVPDMTNEIQ